MNDLSNYEELSRGQYDEYIRQSHRARMIRSSTQTNGGRSDVITVGSLLHAARVALAHLVHLRLHPHGHV